MFKKNEASIERILRTLLGVALLVWFFMAPADAGYKPWLLVGIIPLVTGLIGWCPLYAIFGFSTCPVKKS